MRKLVENVTIDYVITVRRGYRGRDGRWYRTYRQYAIKDKRIDMLVKASRLGQTILYPKD